MIVGQASVYENEEKGMTKVIIAGAAGRMGRRIGYMANEHPDLEIAAGFERPESPDLGKDMGELGGYGTNGIKIADTLDSVIDQGIVFVKTCC